MADFPAYEGEQQRAPNELTIRHVTASVYIANTKGG